MYEPINVKCKEQLQQVTGITLSKAQNFLLYSKMRETLAEASQICVTKRFC